MSRDISVSVVTRVRAGRSSLILGWDRNFSLRHRVQTDSRARRKSELLPGFRFFVIIGFNLGLYSITLISHIPSLVFFHLCG